jgi:hypothetical protein
VDIRASVIEPVTDMHADAENSSPSAVSWAAVAAGGIGAAAISLVLLAFGTGASLSAVSPWGSAVSSTTFRVGSGVYLIVMAMIASSVGGYLAGRLRTKWAGVHTREVFFRDTAHGFLAWAFATLLSAAVFTTATGAIVSGSAAALARVSGQTPALLDSYVDTLVRGDAATGRNAADINATRSEVGRIFATTFQRGGDFDAADRSYLAQVVAANSGISRSEAEQRVARSIDAAKAAVDKARHAAIQLSLWLAASLLVGAFCASLAAIEGGGLRDGTWKYSV